MKRPADKDEDSSSDSEDDFGPRPVSVNPLSVVLVTPSQIGDSDDDTLLCAHQKQSTSSQEKKNDLEMKKTSKMKKKARHEPKLQFEGEYLKNLPMDCSLYERSYMHKTVVTHVCVSKDAEFLLTGSSDGHVKFWKKVEGDIDFVKHYHAHLSALNAMALSPDGKGLVTTSSDGFIKVFDVESFDMMNMINASSSSSSSTDILFEPTAAIWLPSASSQN